jgi:hypothetical protein
MAHNRDNFTFFLLLLAKDFGTLTLNAYKVLVRNLEGRRPQKG